MIPEMTLFIPPVALSVAVFYNRPLRRASPNYSNFYSTEFCPCRAATRFCVTVELYTTSTIWPKLFVAPIPRKLYFPAGWLQKLLREVVLCIVIICTSALRAFDSVSRHVISALHNNRRSVHWTLKTILAENLAALRTTCIMLARK
jgi:hypothetical protein